MARTTTGQEWNGSYVTGSHCGIVVKYLGPTNHRGSRWAASLYRDPDTTWRASVPYADGPLAAAQLLLDKQGLTWQLGDVSSIADSTYCIACVA